MNNILSEKEYQKAIIEYLVSQNKYIERNSKYYNRLFAMDTELLFRFLNDTQPDEMEALRKIYKEKLEETIIGCINMEATKQRGCIIDVLKSGIEISNTKLYLYYDKPATDFNKKIFANYQKNIFSVMEEVWASDKERIDLVIFLNGIAIITFELKCNHAGQSYHDAIRQYRTERNPKTRLFMFKSGVLVNFAMDLEQVYMTTKLDKDATFFLPFNMGNGEGINTGAGNPIYEDKYPVSYMWEDVLTKDSLLELISQFIFLQVKEDKDEDSGRKKIKESVIFPRYHQRNVLHKILADVYENGSKRNYLIQHSAGSGKTNSIAWLAYRLASLHNADSEIIFHNTIIVTDRVVVDRQLQQAIMGMEHKSGFIKVMDDNCTSSDLAIALKGKTKIIATTIQKFPYILSDVKNLQEKRFAVIIDEAHSSTSGKDMAAVSKALGSDAMEEADAQDKIVNEVAKNGKQANVSIFAFTATPKPTTLQLFGHTNQYGQKEAFHLYSMKQAIEEGFILDVLQNYITYNTYYKLNKEIEDDPKCKTNSAKRQIARFVELHDTNIAQKIEIIVEHFRTTVMGELGGKAKAMVVTASREGAVKYHQALNDYIAKKKYTNISALVAFSGKVSLQKDGPSYSEAGINGFSEDKLPKKFDKDEYQVLIVANKYQTGFDQPKLCAMYILKKLRGVNAVQTLSRLNRICPPYEKKTFILDFVNDYKDIESAFSKYYTTTLLSNTITPNTIYDLEAQVDGFFVIDPMDIDTANDIIYNAKLDSKGNMSAKDKKQITYLCQKTKKTIEHSRTKDQQREIIVTLRHFVRFYEFLIQATCFEDVELHKKYKFISLLLSYVSIDDSGAGFNLDGKISAGNFKTKINEKHESSNLVAKPVLKLPTADIILSEDKRELLSQIIADINSRTGMNFNNEVAVKAMLQIKDIMMESESLKASARNNTAKDFEFTYFDNVDDALVEGLEQNKDFFSLLLNNEEIKKQVLGVFADEIYMSLRTSSPLRQAAEPERGFNEVE